MTFLNVYNDYIWPSLTISDHELQLFCKRPVKDRVAEGAK
jgi:hypothetical protein